MRSLEASLQGRMIMNMFLKYDGEDEYMKGKVCLNVSNENCHASNRSISDIKVVLFSDLSQNVSIYILLKS